LVEDQEEFYIFLWLLFLSAGSDKRLVFLFEFWYYNFNKGFCAQNDKNGRSVEMELSSRKKWKRQETLIFFTQKPLLKTG
jgi:hypothetical protein